VRDLVWPRASTVVWLDFPFRVVFRRALVRTFGRIATQEELFAGNRESLRVTLSWDGIPLWVLRTYHRRRREMPVLLALPEHGHLAVIRLARPADADAFLAEVTVAATAARD
jgi:hypothetical protein